MRVLKSLAQKRLYINCLCLSPPPPQRPHHAHALFDFAPHHPSQLRFLRGDVIELIDCSDSLRWRGRCHGHVGHFPPEYVQPIYQCQWTEASIERRADNRRFLDGAAPDPRPPPHTAPPPRSALSQLMSGADDLTSWRWTALMSLTPPVSCDVTSLVQSAATAASIAFTRSPRPHDPTSL